MKILLDYVFPINVVIPTPAPSTAFLRQACVVAKPNSASQGRVGELVLCTSLVEVLEVTDNDNAAQLFNAGMNRVFVLLADDLNLAPYLETYRGQFYTLLISSDFSDTDVYVPGTPEVKATTTIQDLSFEALLEGALGNGITIEYVDTNSAGQASVTVVGETIEVSIEDGVTEAGTILTALQGSAEASALVLATLTGVDQAQDVTGAPEALSGGADAVPLYQMDLGTYEGVTGVSSSNTSFLQAQSKILNRNAFFGSIEHGPKNMFFCFGQLLSFLTGWRNLQYAEVPFDDGVDTLGQANLFFDERISFALQDDEYGNRLAFFAAGGRAIAAPYILKNLRVDMQGAALQWISLNQPDYTIVEASLLEGYIQERVIDAYIDRRWISDGVINISLEQENFVATGDVEVPEPKALWRVLSEFRQTL